jgi:hypothetical protein
MRFPNVIWQHAISLLQGNETGWNWFHVYVGSADGPLGVVVQSKTRTKKQIAILRELINNVQCQSRCPPESYCGTVTYSSGLQLE